MRNQPECTTKKKRGYVCIIKKWVTRKEPLPVFITYFTAWVDREGLLNFREAIDGHDKRLARHLFEQ